MPEQLPKNRIEDTELAHEMALVMDTDMSRASELRDYIGLISQNPDEPNHYIYQDMVWRDHTTFSGKPARRGRHVIKAVSIDADGKIDHQPSLIINGYIVPQDYDKFAWRFVNYMYPDAFERLNALRQSKLTPIPISNKAVAQILSPEINKFREKASTEAERAQELIVQGQQAASLESEFKDSFQKYTSTLFSEAFHESKKVDILEKVKKRKALLSGLLAIFDIESPADSLRQEQRIAAINLIERYAYDQYSQEIDTYELESGGDFLDEEPPTEFF